MGDIENDVDTLVLRADGTFASKSSKLKQVEDLRGYFLAAPLLEDWSVSVGRMVDADRQGAPSGVQARTSAKLNLAYLY
eukprot:SAG31_NODE_4084_length_3603_cov_5.623002_3_plen_79_part_00